MDTKRSGVSDDKKILLIICGPALFLLVLIGGPYIYHEYFYKIQDEVLTGAGYGFNIGMAMEEAIPIVITQLEADKNKELTVFYSSWTNTQEPPPLGLLEHFTLPLTMEHKDLLYNVDTWHITYGPKRSYFDQLKLTFENGNLVLIYRSRHWDLTM